MLSIRTVLVAGALVASSTAMAADMAAPVIEYPAAPVEIGSGWYLRGDIGYTNQKLGSLYNVLYDSTVVLNQYEREFDPSYSIGLGFGYRFNEHLRLDFTGEYRGQSNFYGYDTYDNGGGDSGDDEYTAYKTEWTFLANAYVDLFTWGAFTPFVGAGIGVSYNTIHDLVDTNYVQDSYATGATTSKWNLAWALYAGFGWQLTPKLTMEFAYRYLNLGGAQSGDLISSDGNNYVPNNPMVFNDIVSHDFKLGLRYDIW